MVKKEDVDLALKVAIPLAGVGLVAYVVYKLANPSPNCTTPGSACYSAIQPYLTEFNTCAQQYSDLMGQLITTGQAPSTAQQALLDQLKSCMDTASNNVATTAMNFKVPSINDLLSYIGEAGLVIAISYAAAKYGLPGLANFINNLRSGGRLVTPAKGGAGIAALVSDSFAQYAVTQGYINSAIAASWETSINSLASLQQAGLAAFWNNLAAEGVIAAAQASATISLMNGAIAADAASTVLVLAAAPMTFYEKVPVVSRPYFQAGVRRPCGC